MAKIDLAKFVDDLALRAAGIFVQLLAVFPELVTMPVQLLESLPGPKVSKGEKGKSKFAGSSAELLQEVQLHLDGLGLALSQSERWLGADY